MNVQEVIQFAKDNSVRMIDIKFVDFFGTWQHFTIPMSEFNEDIFEDGLGFDGSSIRGWKAIQASDMIVIPDPASSVKSTSSLSMVKFSGLSSAVLFHRSVALNLNWVS